MKEGILYILLIVILSSCSGNVSFSRVKDGEEKTYRVLLIQSSDALNVLNINQYLIEKRFREADIPVKVDYIYHLTQDVETQKALAALTKRLEPYDKNPPDLILAVNDDSFNYLLATELPFTYRVPIVFSNVTFPLWQLVEKHRNITGQVEVVDFRQAYELARDLFGEIDEMQILYGFQLLDVHYVEESTKQIRKFPELSVMRSSDFEGPWKSKSDTIRYPDSLKYPLTVSWDVLTVWPFEQFARYYDREKPRFPVRRIGIKPGGESLYSMFFSYYYLPCINVNNAYFPIEGQKVNEIVSGCLGGYMNPRENQAKTAVERALRILGGEPVGHIPIDTAQRIPVFDWNAMQHWKIKENQLPEGSRIVNKPFVLKYQNILILGGVLLLSLIVGLFYMLVVYSRRAKLFGNRASRRLKLEQERMQLTVNSIHEGIMSFDRKGIIISINPAALSLLGFNEEDEEKIVGEHIYSILRLSPRNGSRFYWMFDLAEKACATGEKQLIPEGALLHLKNNKTLQIVGLIRALFLNDKHIGTLFTFRDCTDQLRRSRFLEFSMAAGDVYIWQMDEEKRVITFYESDFMGEKEMKKKTDVSYERFLECLHPDDREECVQAIFKMREEKEAGKRRLQVRLLHDSEYIWVETRISSLPATRMNSSTRILGICLVIQALKETEASMVRTLKEAEDSNRLKTEFLANMSHEIRTPLNVILGFSTIIDEVEPEERGYYLELINRNCDILLRTINNILDISRVESGYPFQYKVCNLNHLLSEVWQEQQVLFTGDVNFFLELPEREVLVETDAYRMKQLLEQLIRNASRFTRSGSVVLGCKLSASANRIILFVTDTGIGIRPEDREVVFERFYKLDKFTAGGGLGLSLCKEIVKRMNGKIYIADNASGQGVCLNVELPVHQL